MALSDNNPLSDNKASITLGLLRAVHEDERLTQRRVASDLGIALGMANAFLKRCVKKGFIKIRQAPKNRFAYYLTPHGFAEKSRLTAEFLTQSLSLFRQSQDDYRQLLSNCIAKGDNRIMLFGNSDLCDIVALCAHRTPVHLVGIVGADTTSDMGSRAGIDIITSMDVAPEHDAIIVTDLDDPQGSYDRLAAMDLPCIILVPQFLEISMPRPLTHVGTSTHAEISK